MISRLLLRCVVALPLVLGIVGLGLGVFSPRSSFAQEEGFLCRYLGVGCMMSGDDSRVSMGRTLKSIREKGYLRCGVSQGLPGFSSANDKGQWTGFDVDFCRALSAVIFDDPNKVRYVPLSARARFIALRTGEIDVLSRNTTWTFTRDVDLAFSFAGVTYYDGQGFMVPKSSGITKMSQLSGTICTNAGTTTERNLADYFRQNGMSYEPLVFESSDEVIAAYQTGRCDVFTTDTSGLVVNRMKLKTPSAHVILPGTISKEPLGPVVLKGDQQWMDVNRWLLNALISAEERGITSSNVNKMLESKDPGVLRLLGVQGKLGGKLGLPDSWVYRAIMHVGNYGEIYARNLGKDSRLHLARGLNALWTKGGLIYGLPLR